jgi:hypothetical protein
MRRLPIVFFLCLAILYPAQAQKSNPDSPLSGIIAAASKSTPPTWPKLAPAVW